MFSRLVRAIFNDRKDDDYNVMECSPWAINLRFARNLHIKLQHGGGSIMLYI